MKIKKVIAALVGNKSKSVGTIERHEKKMTKKDAIALGFRTTHISMLLPFKTPIMQRYMDALVEGNNGKEFFTTVKPNVIIREYESSPGLWVFTYKDTGVNIEFLVWTDLYKKRPFKGTSFEVVTPADKEHLAVAFEQLLKHIGII